MMTASEKNMDLEGFSSSQKRQKHTSNYELNLFLIKVLFKCTPASASKLNNDKVF